MSPFHNFESDVWEMESQFEDAMEIQDEFAAGIHPNLGPGRVVAATAPVEEVETLEEESHPLLGPGRLVADKSSEIDELDTGELEIIGADERVQRTNTSIHPYRFICHLELYFPDPDNSGNNILYGGTGVLISPNHVLTAGHCLFSRIKGSRGSSASLGVRKVRVIAGRRNQSDSSLGASWISTWRTHSQWRQNQSYQFDYGLVTLRTSLGSARPGILRGLPLGFWGSQQSGAGTSLTPRLRSGLLQKTVNISGYPGDKPWGTQWFSSARVVNVNPRAGSRLVYYHLDTCGGHSGSPVWIRYGQHRYLVAIHTGPCITISANNECSPVSGSPCFPGGQRYSSNRGVLFTNEVLTQIRGWISK